MSGRVSPSGGGHEGLSSSRVLDIDLSGVPSGAYAFGSVPALVNFAGQLNVELTFTVSADMASQVGSDIYFLSADTAANGDLYIKFVAADSTIRLGVRGSDRITIQPYPTHTNNYPGWLNGQQVTIRAWYDPASGLAGMYWIVQGCAFMPVTAVVSSPPTVPQPTALWLGSNRGSGGLASVQFTRLATYAGVDLDMSPRARIVVLGDSNTSTLGPYDSLWRVSWVSSLLLQSEIAKNPIANLAIPGGTIPSQTAVWQVCPYRGRGDVAAVVIMIGANDAGSSTATMAANYATLTADIHATCKNAKILGVAYFPEAQAIGSTDWANLAGLNAVLAANGADLVASAQVAAMDATPSSPTGNLDVKWQGDTPGARHINNLACPELASFVRPVLTGASLIL